MREGVFLPVLLGNVVFGAEWYLDIDEGGVFPGSVGQDINFLYY